MEGGSGDDASWNCCPVDVSVVVVGGVGVYTPVAGACAVRWCLRSLAGPEGKGGGVRTSFAGAASDG